MYFKAKRKKLVKEKNDSDNRTDIFFLIEKKKENNSRLPG